jgi:p-hydroxybenzoate 3-monooxygenase
LTTENPSVTFTKSGSSRPSRIHCDFIAGCDGFRGVSRSAIPCGDVKEFSSSCGFGWVALLAEVPPSSPHVIFALHPNGFAAHMGRTPQITRFYLQCPVGDEISNWPDDRVWEELATRMELRDDHWHLTVGRILEKSTLDMHNSVLEPMSYGRLFLVGEAAHVVAPVAAKGMNLALYDAERLAQAFRHHYKQKDDVGLQQYSQACLKLVWRYQEFNQWLGEMLHTPNSASHESAFQARAQRARLHRLLNSQSSAAAFADIYAGPTKTQYINRSVE